MFKSPEQGASTEVWAATSPKLDNMAGSIARIATSRKPLLKIASAGSMQREWIGDPEKADRLWADE